MRRASPSGPTHSHPARDSPAARRCRQEVPPSLAVRTISSMAPRLVRLIRSEDPQSTLAADTGCPRGTGLFQYMNATSFAKQ